MPNRKKKLDFTPFSQADVNTMLADVPLLNSKIKAVRVSQWFDKKNNGILYGIEVKDHEGDWLNMAVGGRALIFDDMKLANVVRRAMQSELKVILA